MRGGAEPASPGLEEEEAAWLEESGGSESMRASLSDGSEPEPVALRLTRRLAAAACDEIRAGSSKTYFNPRREMFERYEKYTNKWHDRIRISAIAVSFGVVGCIAVHYTIRPMPLSNPWQYSQVRHEYVWPTDESAVIPRVGIVHDSDAEGDLKVSASHWVYHASDDIGLGGNSSWLGGNSSCIKIDKTPGGHRYVGLCKEIELIDCNLTIRHFPWRTAAKCVPEGEEIAGDWGDIVFKFLKIDFHQIQPTSSSDSFGKFSLVTQHRYSMFLSQTYWSSIYFTFTTNVWNGVDVWLQRIKFYELSRWSSLVSRWFVDETVVYQREVHRRMPLNDDYWNAEDASWNVITVYLKAADTQEEIEYVPYTFEDLLTDVGGFATAVVSIVWAVVMISLHVIPA